MARPERRSGRLRALLTSSAVLGFAALMFAEARSREPQAVPADGRPDAAPSRVTVEEGFESGDVQTRSIAIAMLIGAGVILASIAGLIVMLRFMQAAADRAGPPLTAEQTAPIVAPGPPLQSQPLVDIAALRKREIGTLTTYRWLGAEHAAAQIPISRAMAIVVGRSLDPQARAAPSSSTP